MRRNYGHPARHLQNFPPLLIAVDADPVLGETAIERLRAATGLPARDADTADLVLYRGIERLELRAAGMRPLAVDFHSGKARHRRLHGGGKGQLVARAAGLRKYPRATILDATAGFGQDAFVLASLGARVTLLERSAVVHALLADGLARAAREPELREIVARMTLIHADARLWLTTTETRPEVVHLDPMFPPSTKRARAKKPMQCLHRLLGQDEDADRLLTLARRYATRRVCVKRARHAPALGGAVPDAQILGKRSRYDLYSPIQRNATTSSKA